MLRYEGIPNNEVAKMYGMSPDTTSKMYKRYREQGLEEFCRNKYASHNQKLSYDEEEAILKKFRKEAEAGKIIRAADIKKAFDDIRGKDTGRGYIYMLLKRHVQMRYKRGKFRGDFKFIAAVIAQFPGIVRRFRTVSVKDM